jgi:hypothetical protein
MNEKPLHIWLRFYIESPVFDRPQLDGVQTIMRQFLPIWSNRLRATESEDEEGSVSIGRGDNLFQALHSKGLPTRRPLRILLGDYEGLTFFLDSCASTLPPELNRVAIELYNVRSIEGQAPAEWAQTFFEAVPLHLPVRYANSYCSDEFNAKNMLSDEGGVRAIGVKLSRSLPGLYWLNFFGASYVRMIGKERLLSCPCFRLAEIGGGVYLQVSPRPTEWGTAAYKDQEQRITKHIGNQYFFSRNDPDRKTTAPDFRSEKKMDTP